MCGGALALAQLKSVDQFVRSAPSTETQPFSLESGGERKHVTVLFADIVSSTRLIEGLDPEDAYEILQPTIRIMMDAVHRFGGTVNQVLGDGIMALFGAPLAHEKHATMACLSALLMQANAERFNKSRLSDGDQPVRMRVGLNSGEVVVRAIENDLKFDYRAIGHDVHFADLMQANAAPGEVLASPETVRLAGDLVTTEAVHGMLPEAFRVMDTRIEDDNEGSVSARMLSKMVGRKTELRALADAHNSAMRNEARIVGITGAPGIGKSRLLHEFTKTVPTETCRVLWCTAALQDSSAPLRPIVRLLQRIFGIAGGSDAHTARAAIEQRLVEIGVPTDMALAALMELFNQAPNDPDWIALDPPDRRRHITDTILTVLIGECLERPLVLVVEDLQFADSETCEIVAKLAENARSLPFLMLVSYRPEFQHDWEHQTHFTELRLEPLRYVDALGLLEGHFGTHTSLDLLKETLIERTDGIPFFLEECILHIIESGQIDGTPGDYALNGTLQDIAVPRSVHDVIASRIDHLPPLDKQVLVAAAVVGKDVSSGLLRELVVLPPEDYAACIERLHHAEFLDEARLFPELELTFRHALIQEVAYGTLLRDRRRNLHRQIIEIMETRYATNPADHAERLAHHALEGQLWEKAVSFSRLAGHKALARSAAEEAVRFFECALEIIQNEIVEDEPLRVHTQTLIDLADACFQLGDRNRVYSYICEAKALAESTEDLQALGRVNAVLALYHWMAGDLERATIMGERALSIAEQSGDRPFKIHSTGRLGAVCLDSGDYQRVIELFNWTVENLRDHETGSRFDLAGLPSAVCRAGLAWSYAELGQFEKGLIAGREGLRLALEHKHTFSEIFCRYELGNLLTLQGHASDAISLLIPAVEMCESAAVPVLLPPATATLGHAYAMAGQVEKAIPLLESASRHAEQMNLIGRLPRFIAWLGEAQANAGRLQEARDNAQRALELARSYGQKGHEGWALRLLGDISCNTNSGNGLAAGFYKEAMAIADDMGLRPLLAHCHFGNYRTAAMEGLGSDHHLRFAIEIYTELNMDQWVRMAASHSAGNVQSLPDNVIPPRGKASQ